jgi:lysophospholipase L1-like esterase
LRFLALGDSYTIGQSVKVWKRWPVELARRMREDGTVVLEPEIIAQTGWTASELSTAMDQAALEGTFDIVSLLIGVNDQFRGLEIDQYQREFADLMQRAISFAGGDSSHVIVLSIPDWGVTPFAQGRDRNLITQQIDLFNSVNLIEANSAGARYVDVTGISRQAMTQPILIADDGLHPSGEMYSRWVEVVLPVALEVTADLNR